MVVASVRSRALRLHACAWKERPVKRNLLLSLALLASPFALALSSACSGAPTTAPCPAAPTTNATVSAPTTGSSTTTAKATVEDARAFFDVVDGELRRLWVGSSRAAWINETYITDDTDEVSSHAEEASMEYLGRTIQEATRFDGLALPADLTRLRYRLKVASTLPAPRDAKTRAELASLSVEMTSMYGKGKYCPPRLKGKCLALDEIEEAMAKSRSYDELLDLWTGWHAIAPPIRPKFARYVELGNQGAKEIGFSDLGALWRSGYDLEPDAFQADVDRLWQQLAPFYQELHCYMRAKLHKQYGDKVPLKGPIPAHLLGNMWAQEWENLYDLAEPYKGLPSTDVTRTLKAKKLDEKGMVKIGEGFFTSLGFDPLPKSFWERSLFKKPDDREVVCHASAWDVGWDDDLRLKMCVQISETDLLTIHHELGHDYYYHSYYKLPMLLQEGGNDGFHEAIGDTIALSVTPAYLKQIGLLDATTADDKAEVNHQMKVALEKVAFLPFGKLIDEWRWDVFSGKTSKDQYNAHWWELRQKYQGISAPNARSESDFDPGAKFHVASSTPYIRYFLAAVYQFQFHRALCKAAGHTGPLSTCSIYKSTAAGEKLRAMLALGASKPWPEALATLSGETQADATALLEYFAPLRKWLQEQNKGQTCGW